MHKHSNSHKPRCDNQKGLGKSSRKKDWSYMVSSQQLSYSEAVDRARLIPKSVVAEFKIVAWPD